MLPERASLEMVVVQVRGWQGTWLVHHWGSRPRDPDLAPVGYHLSIRNLPSSTDLLSLRATLRAQGTRILRLTREQVPVGNARVEAPSQAFCSMRSPGVLVGQALQPHTDVSLQRH